MRESCPFLVNFAQFLAKTYLIYSFYMAKVIKLRKGLDVNLKGKASLETMQTKVEGQYALVPDDFYGMKPKVVVKVGDSVKVGDALFVD